MNHVRWQVRRLNQTYMKHIKSRAERRLFGKLEPSSDSERMGDQPQFSHDHSDSDSFRTAVPSPPPYLLSDSDGYPTRCSSIADSLQHEDQPPEDGHQRQESACSLLDYEEHLRDRESRLQLGLKEDQEGDQISMLAIMLTNLRRSLLTCSTIEEDSMDISWPTNVRHVTHVTFDRFNGFLGLPMDFEVDTCAPSASVSVFGVSPESMQCSYDRKGNSVPTILLLMQDRLYSQGGLKAEGIFRINPENSHEQHVREQLNKGLVPHDIEVHCLAGLIKAWFRELPQGVLDSLSPEQVMQCYSEEQAVELVKLLPPVQAALLDWAVNLMADVAQEEGANKMNARNIAMVFAPNMTQMSDPLTALMHAVQVMNLLKTLIARTLRDRQEAVLDPGPADSATNAHNDDDYGGALANGINGRENARDQKNDYDDYGQCARSHVKLGIGKARTGRLVSRIDQHIERVEAW